MLQICMFLVLNLFRHSVAQLPLDASEVSAASLSSSSQPTSDAVAAADFTAESISLNATAKLLEEQQNVALTRFAELFKIEKDQTDPSRLLNVLLPSSHHFQLFVARVTDISTITDNRFRDANRTFLASLSDNTLINIHGLNPGHQYSIEILGRKGHDSTLIKEESIVMDPVSLDFSNADIRVNARNITIRVAKLEKAFQDTFRVEYIQRSPLKRFPILDVHDIQEQRQVELYLGNLSPGRDYDVKVTSLRGELQSQTWKGVIATKPLSPANMSVSFVEDVSNEACLRLSWTLPAESGADSFKIVYGMLHAQNETQKAETTKTEAVLCAGIRPGHAFIFAVVAEKSGQVSEPSTISHTVRPLPARQLTVTADIERAKFRIRVAVPPLSVSYAEKCLITIVSERSERIEQSVKIETPSSSANPPFCEALVSLVPGRRYEISAALFSGTASSTKTFLNKALEPAFNFQAFGLSVRESESEGAGILVEWPQSEVSMLRIADLWTKIVGNESRLHLTLTPERKQGDKKGEDEEDVQQMETAPIEAPHPLLMDRLRMGGCYKIGLYTVTSSGIVSETRYDELVRLRIPRLGLFTGSLTSHSATINTIFLKSAGTRSNVFEFGSSLASEARQNTVRVSSDCALKVIVLDANSLIVYSRSLPLSEKAPVIELDGLKPYFKYSVNAQIICGNSFNGTANNDGGGHCAPKSETLDALLFETRQDRPGFVRNLTARALSPHTVEVSWNPPALRNGLITHYMVNVVPLGLTNSSKLKLSDAFNAHLRNSLSRFTQSETRPASHTLDYTNEDAFVERAWSVNVPANPDADVSADGGESILPLANDAPPLVAVLEGREGAQLAGGRRYRFSVVGVTAAGVGDLPTTDQMAQLTMPISAPPRPSAANGFFLQIEPGSVQTTQFIVTFVTSAFSAKNGPISKIALILTELSKDAHNEDAESQFDDSETLTWAQVQSFDVWPPYTAVEFFPEDFNNYGVSDPSSRRSARITQAIGTNPNCSQAIEARETCNGPLRPASRYRVRLRLFTTPQLWTDTESSEIVETAALRGGIFTVGGVLGALSLICFLCAFLTSLLFAFFRRRKNRRKRQKKSAKAGDPTTSGSTLFDCGGCCYLSTEPYDSSENGAHRYIVNNSHRNSVNFTNNKNNNTKSQSAQSVAVHSNGKYFASYDNAQQQHNNQHQSQASGHPEARNDAKRPAEWTAWLKMIMAERAADCLAKLGLESSSAAFAAAAHRSSGAASTATTTTASSSTESAANEQAQNLNETRTTGAISPMSTNTATCSVISSPSISVVPHKDNSGSAGGASKSGVAGSDESWLSGSRWHSGAQTFNTTTAPSCVVSQSGSSPRDASASKTVTSTLSAPKHQLQPADVSLTSNNTPNGPFNAHHRRSKSLRERTGADQRLERLPSGPPAHKLLLWTVVRGNQPNAIDRNRPVRICDFPEHVRLMSADSDFRFSEEYEDLKHVGVGQTSIAADLTVNRAKNRFTNILPYDHSRVKLRCSTNDDEEDGSDYVNASFISGFNSRREFIAAQGPLPSTRDQFWCMVWEQQCQAIVALTKCVEKGRDKCHQYWPDNSQRSVLYADIEVTLLNESIEYDEFTVRELRLTSMSDPSQPARTVQHLHYMAWPDFGVPDHPAGIVHFSRLFRNKLPPANANKPTIVHCSAGVGRSGTFIALDRLVQNVELGRNIDVFGTVYEMRLERCHMVQNEQQYIFIHHCLLYVLENFFPHLIQRTPGHTTPVTPSATAANGRNVFFGSQTHRYHPSTYGGYTDTMPLNQLRSFAPSPLAAGAEHNTATGRALPKIEVHHNPAFVAGDEDEGIGANDSFLSGTPPSSRANPSSGPSVNVSGGASGQKPFNSDIFMM